MYTQTQVHLNMIAFDLQECTLKEKLFGLAQKSTYARTSKHEWIQTCDSNMYWRAEKCCVVSVKRLMKMLIRSVHLGTQVHS